MTDGPRFAWTCQTCRGKGAYEDTPTETCRICQGKGRNFVEGWREEFTTCLPCGGNGYYRYNRRETCTTCAGVGLVMIPGMVV